MKQYSPAFERNREPIAGALTEALGDASRVLEIGSGSGEHAVWFASRFPHLTWCPTDLASELPSIESWRTESGLPNIEPARELDVLASSWPEVSCDAVVTINTLHIVSEAGVRAIIAASANCLPTRGVLFVYGPFRYADRDLEPSNIRFDAWLRARDPLSGVRDFDSIDQLARAQGLQLVKDLQMPANNRAIWWRKSGH